MAATYEEIEAALTSAWTSSWTATTYTAYENVDFDTASLDNSRESWMEIRIVPGPQSLLDMKNGFIGTVDLIVSAHVPIGWGKSAARTLLDSANAIYEGADITAGTSMMHMYAKSAPVQLHSDGWYKMAVQFSFRLI